LSPTSRLANRRTRTLRAVLASALAAIFLVSLSACSVEPGATLRVLAGEASVDGARVTSEQRISAGEVVEVSGNGALVEIQWTDGSFTRLAEGTRFEIGGTDSRGTLDNGTAWSAVGSAASGYAISTDQGTVVADPNASFAIRCADTCDGVVANGGVLVDDASRAEAPATFTLGGDVAPAGWDAIFADPFALANGARDEQAGFPSAAQTWESHGPALGSVSGLFEGPTQLGAQTCTGWAEECARVESTIFTTDGTQELTFTSECVATLPCVPVVEFVVDSAAGGSRTTTVPLSFDGNTYSFTRVLNQGAYCFFDDGREEGQYSNSISAVLTPTAAEVRDGAYVVTEFAADLTGELVLVEPTTDPTCSEFEYEWSTSQTAELSLVTASAASVSPLPVDASPLRPVAGPARPSVLSDLRTPVQAIPTIDQGILIAGAIVVLIIVLAYPAFLLSRVVSDRYDQLAGRRAARLQEKVDSKPFARRLLLVLGVIIAAIISSAIDPTFGAELLAIPTDPAVTLTALSAFAANLGSWRLVLTALVAFAIFLGLGSLVVRLVGRRIAPGVRFPLQFRWGSLIILTAGVVVSRLFDINPGIIFGLVAGLAIADSISAAGRGRLMFASAAYAILIGVAAWVGFAFVSPLAAAEPTNVGLVFGAELLSAITIEAIATMPLAFLPLMGLDGGTLRSWRFAAWALIYALGLALFTLLLLTVPGSWVEVQGDILRWLIIFGGFTVLSITIWAIHEGLKRRRAKRDAAATEPASTPRPAPDV